MLGGGDRVKAGKRLGPWLLCVGLVAAMPVVGSTSVAAQTRARASSPAATAAPPASAHLKPFLPLIGRHGALAGSRAFRVGGSAGANLAGRAAGAGAAIDAQPATGSSSASASRASAAPLITSTPPDDLTGLAGTAQASIIHSFGTDQEVTPPNEDIAAGPTDLVEVVNSTLEVFNRAGGDIGTADLNSFMHVKSGYHSSDPRVIYDAGSGRFWVTITEVPNVFSSPGDCPAMAPVEIAVSGSSNPLPLTSWLVYQLPHAIFGGSTGQPLSEFGDQPGLGVATNTITVTFNDFTCDLQWNGSEVDILQKTDFEHDTGSHSLFFFYDGPFAPQPVQAIGTMATQYVVTNEGDCFGSVCSPVANVDIFTGTPEGQNVTQQPSVDPTMTQTFVDNSTGFLQPADQEGTGLQLQTNDDRFLNAVWENGEIWTADGTNCTPSGDSLRDCLDYVEIAANSAGTVGSTLTNQLNPISVFGADLFYPAVSLDASGNLFTVFDESSTGMFPSIMAATIASGGSTLSSSQLLHASSTYYDPTSWFPDACDSEGCRWGDYSGAAQDPANPKDVWVVSGSDDGAVEGICGTPNACWNTRIDQLTLAGPTITSLTPPSGPVVGGQTVTVHGLDFAPDTTVTFNASGIAISNLTPESFTFVTAPGPALGATDQVQATDTLGLSAETPASLYTYVGLSNYAPLSPFRILDTRASSCVQCTGGALGPGAIRRLQIVGVLGDQVPTGATAVVLNVTAVGGTSSSLLTVYPYGTSRPNASNLNFTAGTAIPNLVTVALGAGAVNIYNALGTVNVVADVEGYFEPQPSSDVTGEFHPIAPIRMCDTRTACGSNVAVRAERVIVVNVTGTGGIPSDGTAEAAVLNLTGVAGTAATYLSVFPTNASGGCTYTGTHAPPFSTLNLLAGAVEANRVMVQLGPASPGAHDTSVCVYNAAGTINVILDANGWYGSDTAAPGSQYQAIAPSRVCDTRVGSPACTKATIGAAVSRLIGIAGDASVPAFGGGTNVVAVIANLTAVAPTQATFLALYPANLTRHPNVSDLNLNAGAVLPNLAVVALDTAVGDANDGKVFLYNSAGAVNAVIDIEGWFQ